MSRTGVIVMAYGTPSTPDEIEAYYTHIRHGRAPSPEALTDLTERYEAIGGVSPLNRITRAQVDGLAAQLPEGTPVVLGMKHATPMLEDAVDELLATGVDRIIGLVLAPHYSVRSIEEYQSRVRERIGDQATFVAINSWALEPGLIDLLAANVTQALTAMQTPASDVQVLFTAHSLPARILESGDPYPDELRATAEAVAAKLGLPRWGIAWQSAGQTGEPWIGPDVLDAMSDLASAGTSAVLVCSAGFVSDHLEVLYDLDIEAAEHAATLGIEFARTASANDDPRFLDTLASLVQRELATATAAAGSRV